MNENVMKALQNIQGVYKAIVSLYQILHNGKTVLVITVCQMYKQH